MELKFNKCRKIYEQMQLDGTANFMSLLAPLATHFLNILPSSISKILRTLLNMLPPMIFPSLMLGEDVALSDL